MKKVEIVDIEEIQELLFSFAEGDYSRRLEISENSDERDIIVSGINMLGEELESSTVSKDYFKSIYNAISDAVIVTDINGEITSFNSALESITGESSDTIIGMDVRDFYPSDYSRHVLNSVIKKGSSYAPFEHTVIIDDELRHYSCTISKILSKYDVHEGFLIIAKDITVEKKLEFEVLNAIITTEEKEKKRLAYDLHDALGQELNSVKMFFDSLLHMNKSSKTYNEVLTTCKQIIDDCISTTRNLSYNLMPKSLEEGALFSAVQELSARNNRILKFRFEIPQKEYPVNIEKKINIYRIYQEFISNSIKHGGATEVFVKSSTRKGKYYFEFSDNGNGFDITRVSRGRGLKNISSRLKVIGADYKINSVPDEGTCLKFSF